MFCLPEVDFFQTEAWSKKFRYGLGVQKPKKMEGVTEENLFQTLSEVAKESNPLKSRYIYSLQQALKLPTQEWIEECLFKQDFAPLFLAVGLMKEDESLEEFIQAQSFAEFPLDEKQAHYFHEPFLQALYNFPFEFCTRIFSVFLTDESDRPKTIWELTLTLQGFYTLFYKIPKVCITPLSSLIKNPYKRYGIIFMVTSIALLTLYIYVRWFRGLPDRARHVEKGRACKGECLFRESELKDLVATLDGGQSAVLLGKSGVGKTEVLLGVEEHINKKVCHLKASSIVSGSSFGPGPQLKFVKETLRDLVGGEHKVLFLVDEANVFLEKLLPLLLKETNHTDSDWQFLFATTTEQYNTLLINEDFKPLDGRLHKVHLKQLQTEKIFLVLKRYLQKRRCPFFVSKKALKKVIQLSGKCSTRAQPAAAKYLLDQVCAQRAKVYHSYKKEKNSKSLEIELSSQSSIKTKQFKKLRELRKKEAIQDPQKKQIKEIKLLFASRLFLQNERIRVAREIKKVGDKAQFEKRWLYFMNFILIPALDKIIKKKGKEYKIPVRITSKVVERVVKNLVKNTGS